VNKHLYLCHPLVLSSPTLMMHGHTNLKTSEKLGEGKKMKANMANANIKKPIV